MNKKVFIGADHRGVRLKARIIQLLERLGYVAVDVGTNDESVACDYPEFSYAVAKQVAGSRGSRGILVCMTGIGHSIAANKVPGVYAALCYNVQAAALSREHNNTNVLVLGSKFVTEKEIQMMIKRWLTTDFEGGRHLRRLKKIKGIEKQHMRKG